MNFIKDNYIKEHLVIIIGVIYIIMIMNSIIFKLIGMKVDLFLKKKVITNYSYNLFFKII